MNKVVRKATGRNQKSRRKINISLVVLIVVVVGFLYTVVSLQSRLSDIREQREEFERKTALKQEEYDNLKQRKENNSTVEALEEKARDEGYVGEDETVFVVVN